MLPVRKIISELKLDVWSVEDVPESYSSDVYKLKLTNQEMAYLKIPYNKDKLIREYRMLERIKDKLPVPKVLDYWDGDEQTVGALLLSAIQGEPLTGIIDHKTAYDIGVHHAKLHEISMPGYGYEDSSGYAYVENNSWRSYIQSNFEKWQSTCKEILDPSLYEKCIAFFNHHFRELPDTDGPCAVHMDFRPGNILIKDNRVAGIIDFESSRGGSSEIDFTKMNRYVWKCYLGTRQAYMQGYESIRPLINLDLVLPFYNFYDAFGAIVWCKNRGIDKNRSFLFENIAVLQKATEQHSS